MKPKTKLLYLAAFLVVALPLLPTGNAGAGYYWDGAVPSGTTDNWITPNDMVCIVGVHTDGTLDRAYKADGTTPITNSRECIYLNTGKMNGPTSPTSFNLTGMNPIGVTATHAPVVITVTPTGFVPSASPVTTYGECTNVKKADGTTSAGYLWDFVTGGGRCLDVSACSGTDATTKGTLTWNAGSSTCSDSAACTVVGKPGNDGAKHALTTSICVDGSGNGIPLTDLDRTFAMCAAKGGTWKQTSNSLIVSGSGATATATVQVAATITTPPFGGACVAYTRQFAGQDNATGLPLDFGPKGTLATNAGFCYASMNMTSAYPTQATCPASDTSASNAFDWSWSSSKCTYAKGTKGYLNSALTKVDATTSYAAGIFVDLSVVAPTMGECLAIGASWANWLGASANVANFGKPASTTTVATTSVSSTVTASFDAGTKTITKTVGTSFVTTGFAIGDTIKTANASNPGPFTITAVTATVITVAETVVAVTPAVGVFITDLSKPKPSTIPVWDFAKQAVDADNGCLHCHSTKTQYNGPAERMKDSYLKTGHKNIFRKVTPDKDWAGPDMDGVLKLYTDAATGPIDFSAAKAWIGGVWRDLLYIFGDWMTPAPDGLNVIVDMGGYAKANGTSSEICASCHTTGWNNPAAGLCSFSSKTTEGDCTGAGGKWYPSIGVEGIGTSGFTPAEPAASFPTIDFTGAGRWVRDGIQCSRCHNATIPTVTSTKIAASDYKSTHATGSGMGSLADGVGRTNLCFGCHQSIAKEVNGTGADAELSHPEKLQVTNTATAPNYVPDFYGRGPGNMFLNSPHARFTGKIVPNSLGKYDLEDPTGNNDGNASKYNSKFQGYTCWQSPTSTSPAKTWIDSGGKIQEIKTQAKCEELYGPGTWRTDNQGTCVTCHDVHNSLFVEEQKEAALRKVCTDCHDNKSFARINHLDSPGTPLDVPAPAEACVTCHMPRATSSGLRMHLFRINPDVDYRTFPTATDYDISDTAPTKRIANAVADRGYDNAVWVDVDYVCGQCHGGSFGPTATRNSAPYFLKSELSRYAEGMHRNVAPPTVSFTSSISDFKVTLTDTSTDDSVLPDKAITVKWGDGTSSTGNAGDVFSHTYATAKTFQIVYSVIDRHGASASKKITVAVGFSITANVSPAAPSNAEFILLKANGKSIIKNGWGTASYVFSGLAPGTYKVKVQHASCAFDGDSGAGGNQNPITVVIGTSNKTVAFTRIP